MSSWKYDVPTLAEKLTPKCRDVVLGSWPRDSWGMHRTHIRFLNRHELIEQHNARCYRLTAKGQEVRALAARQNRAGETT